MDGKGQHGWSAERGQSSKRHLLLDSVKNHWRNIPFWKVRRSVVISGLLFVAIASLLIGIIAQLPGPEKEEAPAGEQLMCWR